MLDPPNDLTLYETLKRTLWPFCYFVEKRNPKSYNRNADDRKISSFETILNLQLLQNGEILRVKT